KPLRARAEGPELLSPGPSNTLRLASYLLLGLSGMPAAVHVIATMLNAPIVGPKAFTLSCTIGVPWCLPSLRVGKSWGHGCSYNHDLERGHHDHLKDTLHILLHL